MSLPDSMKYIDTDGAGAPEVMKLATGSLPVAKPDEVLIRVMTVGINRPDVLQRLGQYPVPPGASPVMGLEAAGEVVAVGSAVKHLKIGQKVCALTNGGAYAEYVVAPETQSLPWPTGYDALHAGAVPENYFTVWANLFMAGKLKAGESVLIHGGSSGIGVTAIQLAKEIGATVYATAGSDEKVAACFRFGAAAGINYRTTDFADEIRTLTDKRGVDAVLDMVGAPYATRNIRSLAMDGRLVMIAFLHGSKVENFDLLPIMLKRLIVTGSTMRPRTTAQKAEVAADLWNKVWPMLSEGRAKPVIHKVFPLAQVAEAHALMETSTHIGKIMLQVAD